MSFSNWMKETNSHRSRKVTEVDALKYFFSCFLRGPQLIRRKRLYLISTREVSYLKRTLSKHAYFFAENKVHG